jgi:nicotinamidase-related amidase
MSENDGYLSDSAQTSMASIDTIKAFQSGGSLMKTALIVIDVQESFRHRPYFSQGDLPAYLQAQNLLIQEFKRRNWPIVRVFHVDEPDTPSNPFSYASGHIQPLQGLADFDASHTVTKSRHSAFAGTGLDIWLTQQGIGKLIVSGIRTEQCCETTTRHASDLGWQVDYALDATLTFDMLHLDGSPLSVTDIKARTAAVLNDRFARVCTAAQALED